MSESGRKVAIGIGLEGTRSTSVAPTSWIERLEQDFIQKVEKQMNESGMGVLDKNNAADIFKLYGGGKVGGKVQDQEIGMFLSLAAGQKPVTTDHSDSDPSVKLHTGSQSQSNTPLTGTISIKDGLRDERYPLASVAEFELSQKAGDWLKFSATFLSKSPTSSAGNVVAYNIENEFKSKHAKVQLAATEAALDAAPTVPLATLQLNIMRQLRDYQVIGSDDLYDIFTDEVDYKGDFSMLFDTMDHRNSYINNTNQFMRLTWENTDVTIGASARPKLVITLAKVNFSDWGVNTDLGKMVEQNLGFTPLYNKAAGKTWDWSLVNTKASY